ncbi:MAG TPA: hypothetical protein PK157_22705 [Bryobacteraceae bacterium]|nr:hypothetical protein [Bryobacteraceae bacterium]
MFDCARSTRCSPDDRLGEVAAILAAGLLRLGQRAALPAGAPLQGLNVVPANVAALDISAAENPPKEPATGLELSDKTVLSVRVG